MVKITLLSLLHSLGPRFPVYPVSLLTSLLATHQGEVLLPSRKGNDIAALRKQLKGVAAHDLASLDAGWCDFAASDSGDTPELDALANYDTEMMDNLLMYWHSAAKINSQSPITCLGCAARWWMRPTGPNSLQLGSSSNSSVLNS